MTGQSGTIERLVDRLMPGFMRPFWDRVRTSNIGYRLAHGAFWSTIGAGLPQALMLVTSIIIARILGREHFGEYGIVFSTVGMFNVVAGFGLGTTATKYVAELRHTDSARTGRIIAMSILVAIGTGLLASVILLCIAPLLARQTLASTHISPYLRIGTGLILFGAINGAQVGALAGFEAFKVIARINLVAGIFSFPLILAGAYFIGLPGALAGQVVAQAVTCLINNLALRKLARESGIPLGYAGCWQERSVLVRFSLPAVLSGIMVSPVNWVCAAILVNQPHGYSEMGIFNAANSWQKAILFIPASIGAITLPILSQLHGANERKEYRKTLAYNVILNGGAALTTFAMVSIFSKVIMRSYGPSFEIGYGVLILLCFSSVLISVDSVIGNAIASANKMWFAFVFNTMWGIAYIAFVFVFVPRFGAMGLALANVSAYLLHTFWQLLYLKRV